MLGELPADVERLIEYALVAGDRFGEDCLTVNVWTPAADDSGRPVMVWFHGGGQTIGSGNMPIYDGSNLARVGDTVVVTVNHRLGVLGYLSLTESTGPEYLTSGNAGLLDMIASLRWVRGTSRSSVATLGTSPFRSVGWRPEGECLAGRSACCGLFHQAIIQSGPGLRAVDASSAATTSAAILERLGSPTIDELVDLPVDRLLAAQVDVLGGALPTGSHRLGPTVDGSLLPVHPFDPVAAATAAEVPLIIGTTHDEMTLFLHHAPMLDDIDHEAAAHLAPSLAQGVTDLYPTYHRRRPCRAIPTPGRDRHGCPADRFDSPGGTQAGAAAAPSGCTAVTSRARPTRPLGATHGIDLPLVFDDLPVPLLDGQPAADTVAATMSEHGSASPAPVIPNQGDVRQLAPVHPRGPCDHALRRPAPSPTTPTATSGRPRADRWRPRQRDLS